MNYKDWFDEQDRNTQIDIVGPARYREYVNGKEVTCFAKDGRVMSLEELSISRTTRLRVFEEIYKDSAIPIPLTDKQIDNLYNDKLTDIQLQEAFKKRYTHVEVDIVGKMPRDQMQILFREYDKLLQEYPVGNKLMSIDVQYMQKKSVLETYYNTRSAIVFNREFVNGNVHEIIKDRFNNNKFSTNNINHVYVHEFAHAIDYAIKNKNSKIGRQLLLLKAHKYNITEELEKAWIDLAKEISEYAAIIPQIEIINEETGEKEKVDIKSSLFGGEFFAEGFTAWRDKKVPMSMQWLIDFYMDIKSIINNER